MLEDQNVYLVMIIFIDKRLSKKKRGKKKMFPSIMNKKFSLSSNLD